MILATPIVTPTVPKDVLSDIPLRGISTLYDLDRVSGGHTLLGATSLSYLIIASDLEITNFQRCVSGLSFSMLGPSKYKDTLAMIATASILHWAYLCGSSKVHDPVMEVIKQNFRLSTFSKLVLAD